MGDTPEIEKKYFSIGEVAEQFNVATSLIRFWETHFDSIKPRKSKNGARQYTKKDIESIRLIFHLVKEKGYTLQGAKERIKLGKEVKGKMEILDALKSLKVFLEQLRDSLPPSDPK